MEEKFSQAAADSGATQPDEAGQRGAEAERTRKLQALQMQRERILSERTSNQHRRSALENALADIEEKLAELGWTVHL